jgi:two-component system chemotaxis response regulator CheY
VPLVLIVDDMSLERRRVRELVAREGYAFAEAANGLEALAMIDQQRPDCILTDLTMPEMDGFQLLGILQSRENRIPVMVLTADRQAETRAECQRLGAVTVLHKAWSSRVLGEALQDALHTCLAAAGAVFTPPPPS